MYMNVMYPLPRNIPIKTCIIYRLKYKTLFGGSTALSRKTYEKINGFTNIMFGWGGEDDNTWER